MALEGYWQWSWDSAAWRPKNRPQREESRELATTVAAFAIAVRPDRSEISQLQDHKSAQNLSTYIAKFYFFRFDSAFRGC